MPDIYKQASFQNIILTILAVIVIIIILWCIYTFIRAIFFFIFSHNKDEYKKKWQSSIRFMLIGIILTIVLLLLIPTLFKLMNIPDYQTYTTKSIFQRAGKLMNSIFNLGDIIKESQNNNQYKWDLYYDTNSNAIETDSSDNTTNYKL